MLLALEICQNTIRGWKYLGLIIYIAKIIVGLLVIITATVTMGSVVAKGNVEEMRKALISIAKKIAAAILVFLVPGIVHTSINLLVKPQNNNDFNACEVCLNEPNGTKCADSIAAYDKSVEDERINFELEKLEGELDTCDMGLTSSVQLNYSYKGKGKVKGQFSKKTMKIVEKHLDDFTYENYYDYINRKGGHKKYAKKLGGYFKKYYGKTLEGKTETDLLIASEYVFGYMTMYGFDYFNGKGDNGKYCKWGGGCINYTTINAAKAKGTEDELNYPSGTSDAFYPGTYRHEVFSGPKSDFDKLLEKNVMTTNCNWTVDMVYWKAGIFKAGKREDGTPEFQQSTELQKMGKYGKIITRMCDLKVGDILHFFNQPISPTDPSTWNGWRHVAYVGEINAEEKTITVYDGGSYFTKNRNYKWTIDVSSGQRPKTLHGFAGWTAVRVKDLISQ